MTATETVDPWTTFTVCPTCNKTGTCGSVCTAKRRKRKPDNDLPDGVMAWYEVGVCRTLLKLRGNKLFNPYMQISPPMLNPILLVADADGLVTNAIFAAKRIAKLGFECVVYASSIKPENIRWREAAVIKLTAKEKRERKALEAGGKK